MPSLLSIPRELHDNIYDGITISADISEPYPRDEATNYYQGWHPRMCLFRTVRACILLVCRQIHDEYFERTISKSRLWISLYRSDLFSPDKGLKLKPNFPAGILKGVKRCEINVYSLNFSHRLDNPKFVIWDRVVSRQTRKQQEALPWTPTKEMCKALQGIFPELHALLHESARVKVEVALSRMSLQDDQVAGTDASVSSERLWHRYDRLLHAPTLTSPEAFSDVIWPARENLDVGCFLTTPLYYTLPNYRQPSEVDSPGPDVLSLRKESKATV